MYASPIATGPLREWPLVTLTLQVTMRAPMVSERPRTEIEQIQIQSDDSSVFDCASEGDPSGVKLVCWNQYGPSIVLQTEAGESIWLSCDPTPSSGNLFKLWYKPYGGQLVQIGFCRYVDGENTMLVDVAPGTESSPRRPSCLVFGQVINRDYGADDAPQDGLLEWSVFNFFAKTFEHDDEEIRFQYAFGEPHFADPNVVGNEGAIVDRGPINRGLPRGSDSAGKGDAEATISSWSLADLNRDGLKTQADRDLFDTAYGKCAQDAGYLVRADIDVNGCVDEGDLARFEGLLRYNLPFESGNHHPVAKTKNVVVAEVACQNSVLAASVDDGSHDPDGDEVTLTLSPAGPLGVGTHVVWLTATDPFGASDTQACSVTVTDGQSPTLVCPPSVETNQTSGCAGPVPDVVALSVASDNCSSTGELYVYQSPKVGTVTASGSTITVVAIDRSGNSTQRNVSLVVRTSGSPVVTCGSVTVNAGPDACAASVIFSPTATDSCGRPLQATCIPASGSVFPVGNTSVTSTAVDEFGHVGTCTFTVTVRDVTAPSFMVPSRVEARSSPGESVAVVDYPVPS
ncbi:MAG: HYR domain-containing protein, partial [Blastocatellia bacterium]